MAVFTEESVKANIRTRDGKRVFYLADSDRLTPSARQWLQRERIQVLPAAMAKPSVYRTLHGLELTEKPEYMTHLRADVLVNKDHPRIRFRGCVDQLEAELLLAGHYAGTLGKNGIAADLNEVLELVRMVIRCDVLEEPLHTTQICGLTLEQIREHSHFPQKYYDTPHFMPKISDSSLLLVLNRVRTCIRQTELAAYDAFRDRDGAVTRPDILTVFNRMSSLLWLLMIRMKREECYGTELGTAD